MIAIEEDDYALLQSTVLMVYDLAGMVFDTVASRFDDIIVFLCRYALAVAAPAGKHLAGDILLRVPPVSDAVTYKLCEAAIVSLGSRDIESSVCKVILSLYNVDLVLALRLQCGHPMNLVAFLCSADCRRYRLLTFVRTFIRSIVVLYVYVQRIIAVA